MADWHYVIDGVERGPVQRVDLERLARDGTLRADALVWTNTMAQWEPAHRHIDGIRMSPPPLPGTPMGAGHVAAGVGGRDYHRRSGLGDAFRQFFGRYAQFSGRSNRGEFWFWQIDNLFLVFVIGFFDGLLFGTDDVGVLGAVYALATLIPAVALSVRRLHDIDKSGWWVLLGLIPIVGWIILLVWYCTRPDDRPNRFG